MTRAKLVGKILWALRLGLLLLGPSLVLLVFGFITLLPTRPIYLACLVAAMLSGLYIYYGLTCNLAFPLQRPQTDNPSLKKWGMLWLGASGFLLALCTALQWLHSGPARDSDTFGLQLFFVRPGIIDSLFIVAGLCHFVLLFLLIKSIVKNASQLRLLTWFFAISTGLYPMAMVAMTEIEASKTPEWQIRQTLVGRDKNTYYFLRKKRFFRESVFTALAMQAARNPFFDTVDFILVDTQTGSLTGALKQGKTLRSSDLREACEAMLKMEATSRKINSPRRTRSSQRINSVAQFLSAPSASLRELGRSQNTQFVV